ncbi:AraC family transcriptional regulator [Allomuricauda sp. SCSIO 65647]|uniref:AraC family transcriptional regulator n=1 Tax=Allomuricauda sp. SCSIO 65647 TaxID=2908843 RepID=UPI001F3F06D5|nr:AraC family transcriptional regulator [Muricauda sp. SCSIO 65647]UJH68896.1 AraC family transcriptional regulator [Muricauda sp. SCSIO 65647]
MKPELEKIDIGSSSRSVHFFKLETAAFPAYWHYHPEIELTFIIKGEGTRFVGNSIAPFTDYDLVLVGKNTPHHWVSLMHDAPEMQKAIVFQFSADMFSSFKECERFGSLFELARRGIQFKDPAQEIVDLITVFEHLDTIQQLGAIMEILRLLTLHDDKTLLATEVYAHHHNQKDKIEKFAKINNYILEHLDHKLTVAKMADISNMVPQSFCRWFKQNSGYSFITFLNKTRIENACQLLTHNHLSIQQIAFSSGFESLSHFNRTFKKFKQQSPTAFKKTYHQ